MHCRQGVDLDTKDVGNRSVSFYLLSQDLAERSGLDVMPTFRRYILGLMDEKERILFNGAYSMAAEYNQTAFEQRNAVVDDNDDDDDDSEATVDENERSSTGGDGHGSDDSSATNDDSSDDSIDRRLASIGESQADQLFYSNRHFP